MGWTESDGESDFASIFASVAQEQRERAERHQTKMMLRVLDEMDASSVEAPASKRREMQRGVDYRQPGEPPCRSHAAPVWTQADEEEFRAFQEFRRARRSKEFMRGDEEEDEIVSRARREKAVAKAARDEKVRKVHTLDDLPRDDFGMFFGGPPVMDPPPELRIEEGRRLKDGERFYTASLPGWFEHVDLGVWMFRIEVLLLLGVALLLLGAYIGRRTLGAVRVQQKKAAEAVAPQIIYALPPGLFQMPKVDQAS